MNYRIWKCKSKRKQKEFWNRRNKEKLQTIG